MASLQSRLTGWQRLWFVFSIICFLVTTFFVVTGQREPPKDEVVLQQFANRVKRIEIPAPEFIPDDKSDKWRKYLKGYVVEFPDDVPDSLLSALITKHYEDPDSIHILAANLLREQNNKQIAFARDEIKESNIRLIAYGYIGWLIGVVFLYLFGWSIGWIYRGFKKA
jgi:hypothetical protein